MSVICFHNPNERNGYLSNWYKSTFEVDGVKFTSMEQCMMYGKAMLFNDVTTAKKIMNTQDVARIKALGREVKHFNEQEWNKHKECIVLNGLYAKFTQNEELKKKLLDTGDNLLAECAVKDRIWGIGLSMTDSNRLQPDRWRGQNLLGRALMEVRFRIRLEENKT